MGNRKYKKESLLYLVLVTAVLFFVIRMGWRQVYTNESVMFWTMGFLAFLFLFEWITMMIVNKQSRATRPQQLVRLYMLLKGSKLFLFLGTLIIYLLTIQVETKRFVLVAVALYFIYLLLDTLFLSWFEKGIKIENQKKNDTSS